VNEFLQTALTFPTVVYSVLLTVCAVYWLLAAMGLADGDAADALAGGDGDGVEPGGAAALLAWLGLPGVPVMIVATALTFSAWFGTYFVHLLVLRDLPQGVRVAAGAGTALGMLVPAAIVTSVALRPLRRAMGRLSAAANASLLGRTAVLITPTLGPDYGQASMDDGGAGLILQVRGDDPNPLQRGDRVVLVEYDEARNAYHVVPEQQFLGR
jgi:hypothetical protein